MMLYKVLAATRTRVEARVLALGPPGPMQAPIADLGVEVLALGMLEGVTPTPLDFFRLAAAMRSFRPDVVQGWMYHGNVAALAGAALAAVRRPVLWNVRSTLGTAQQEKQRTAAIIRLGARLSHRATAVVYPSEVAADEHERVGYATSRRVLIANGFDTDKFAPDPAAREELRQVLGLSPGTWVVGHVARYHDMKDHDGLLRAFALLRSGGQPCHLVLAGRGVSEDNAVLTALRAELRLDGRLTMLGERRDVHRLTAGFDIAVSSSSWGEAFPNAIGEAMACGVPCVATDVGDSARIVGDTGLIVPPRDPAALAAAIQRLALLDEQSRRAMGEAARARVMAEYALGAVAARYEALWTRAAQSAARAN